MQVKYLRRTTHGYWLYQVVKNGLQVDITKANKISGHGDFSCIAQFYDKPSGNLTYGTHEAIKRGYLRYYAQGRYFCTDKAIHDDNLQVDAQWIVGILVIRKWLLQFV